MKAEFQKDNAHPRSFLQGQKWNTQGTSNSDVALGWPLRYSHSPAEVIDTKDLDALGKIVEVLARTW
jgi:putative aminopeptidase FrvX